MVLALKTLPVNTSNHKEYIQHTIYLELQCMHSDACIPVYNHRNNNNVDLLLITLIHEALILSALATLQVQHVTHHLK